MSRRRQKEIATGERVSKEARPIGNHLTDDLVKKGTFLIRQFGNPRGHLLNAKGKSTLLALSAAKWGEAVPKNSAAARKLAKKGESILARVRHQAAKARAA